MCSSDLSVITNKNFDAQKELTSVIKEKDIKNEIIKFFESFQVADIFMELSELERNKNVLDKQEFYLYFCDVTYKKTKYPIFFIPFEVSREGEIFSVEFDAQVYINKKAIEFIAQEYNRETGKKGSLQTITERIIYLAQHKEDFKELINSILFEISGYFELDKTIDITQQEPQDAKGLWTKVSNSCYVCLFDKSDEALVNDYEDILQQIDAEDSELADAFNILIEDFIEKDPQPFNPEIEDEWDNADIDDKLVYQSPIPLNSEQLQILSATHTEGCKYITVEGPPGTGKSHTITAIAFHAILNDQAVLVLSDKKEALDVVEDKVTATMNKVRHDKKFQNPVLRLGKTGSTYNQILSTSSMDNIKTHHRVTKKKYDNLESSISKLSNTLKEDIEAETVAYSDIDINEIREFVLLDNSYNSKFIVDIEEVIAQSEAAIELEEIRNAFLNLKNVLTENDGAHSELLKLLNIEKEELHELNTFKKHLKALEQIAKGTSAIKTAGKTDVIQRFKSIDWNRYEHLEKFIQTCEELKKPIVGYLFKKKQLQKLDDEFRKTFKGANFENPSREIFQLNEAYEVFTSATDFIKQKEIYGSDSLMVFHKLVTRKGLHDALGKFCDISEDLKYLSKTLAKYPKSMKIIGVKPDNVKTLYANVFLEISDDDFNELIRYISLRQKIEKDFLNLPSSSFSNQITNLEDMVTAQMAHIMDGRVIDFFEHNKATARALRDIIRSKRRFPKEEFEKLKDAFPLILAGIRDYAEYIPLEPGLFDLVIIDEASQVSIAQAFPALLRAKKVLILGDKKQFSNVKAAQARSDTNRGYLNNLQAVFKRSVSSETTKLVKLEKFNIRTSILEFFEFITNYNIQLMKYFRGYKEIISYSDKYFYQRDRKSVV